MFNIFILYKYVCIYKYIICSYITFVVELTGKSFDTCEGQRLVLEWRSIQTSLVISILSQFTALNKTFF